LILPLSPTSTRMSIIGSGSSMSYEAYDRVVPHTIVSFCSCISSADIARRSYLVVDTEYHPLRIRTVSWRDIPSCKFSTRTSNFVVLQVPKGGRLLKLVLYGMVPYHITSYRANGTARS
jgi:hypothetical protein